MPSTYLFVTAPDYNEFGPTPCRRTADRHARCLEYDMFGVSNHGKKALLMVPEVSKVDVSYERKEACVSFDDAKASVAKLEDATFESGYPAKLKPAKK